MKLQLFLYVLCFLAVAAIGLRAETAAPVFGGTVGGTFEINITDQPIVGSITMVSSVQTVECQRPNCPKMPTPAIHSTASAEQP